MYLVLDKNLKVCGTLRLDGKGCRFYNDLITTQIADDSGKLWNQTMQISVPYGYPESDMMTEGFHLLHQGPDGKWYCFRINSWTDALAGAVHVKQVQAVNLAIWDLAHTTVTAGTLTNATNQQAFVYCLQRSGWTIGVNTYSGGTKTEEFQLGASAQSMLQQLNTDYAVEIRAYVEVYNGQVVGKYIDIMDQLGEETGARVEYSRNMTDITRQGGDDTLYTMLHVYGGTPSGSDTPVSIAPANGGADFITDEDANDLYNGSSDKYLEGYVQNTSILNPSGLLAWGREQLAYYNHPKYNYTVGIAELEASLGDTVRVVDFEMSPILTISARAIQQTESEANPQSAGVTLGEFVEIHAVTPDDIEKLAAKADDASRAAVAAQAPKFMAFTPDGTDFAGPNDQKRLIVRAYQGMTEVTYTLDPEQYVWQKINADGTHDTAWEAQQVGIGNVVMIDLSCVGCTIRCTFRDDTEIASRPVYFQAGMTATINKLAALQTSQTLSVLFITDTHYATGGYSNKTIMMRSVDHLRNAVYLTNKIPIDLVVHGGDLVDGDEAKPQEMDDFKEAASNLANNIQSPLMFLNGNHDDASLFASHGANRFEDVLTPDDRYSILSPMIGPGISLHSGYENRLYGFTDFTSQKIRVIFLNSFENPYIANGDGTNKYQSQFTLAFMQDQLDWLANAALQMPAAGWGVLIFSHSRFATDLTTSYKNINAGIAFGIIQAYKNGTSYTGSGTTTDYAASINVDFTSQGARDVIAIINGHSHYDAAQVYQGINLIETLDCMPRNDYPGDMPDRPFPALTEDAWDVFTIDRTARKIYATRFGAGYDRQFSY